MIPIYEELLLSFAFNFKLRHCTSGFDSANLVKYHASDALLLRRLGGAVQVDPIKPMLKPPGIKRVKLE